MKLFYFAKFKCEFCEYHKMFKGEVGRRSEVELAWWELNNRIHRLDHVSQIVMEAICQKG